MFSPSTPRKKRGGVAVKLPNSEVHIHWKGAAEIILASCTRYIDSDDQVAAMDDDKVGFYSKQLVVLQWFFLS